VTRRIGVPYTLGLVVVGLVIAAFRLLPDVRLTPVIVLTVFLPALLFEGGWSLTLSELRQVWLPVALLVGPGLLLTVGVSAVVLHLAVRLDWGSALLLSAILAPTDPVAVLGLFRELGVGRRLRTTVEGESLFNDGVASVLYTVVLGLALAAYAGHGVTGVAITIGVARGIFQLAIGGVLLGVAVGAAIGFSLRWVNDPLLETTVTLVAAYGVYLLADDLGLSGILAVVVLALLLRYFGRRWSMSERTRAAVQDFWSQVAFIANALLFLLIGAQIDVRAFFPEPGNLTLLEAAGWAIVAVLGGRAVAVYALSPVARALHLPVGRVWPPVLLWAGLRGALSLAFVLALPLSLPNRELLVSATYGVVLFTLLVQGLTLRSVLKRAGFSASHPADAHPADS
jgi:monovalent cation:H+ antiporter, CPA1 family